jgi:hypothetical protein
MHRNHQSPFVTTSLIYTVLSSQIATLAALLIEERLLYTRRILEFEEVYTCVFSGLI